MKGNFSLKSLSSPSPLQLKSSSSPRWMSLRAWKTMTDCSAMLTARGTMFCCFLEWLMKRALLPKTRESTLSQRLSLKVQKRLFSTRLSRSFSRLMLPTTSPRYFITNSPLRTNSSANSPSPAPAILDFPTRVRLLRWRARSLFWHQLALPSSSSQRQQCSQTPGRHMRPFRKQGHLFSQQLLSPRQRQPFSRSSHCSEHAQEGRQYPRVWHSQSRQLTSEGSRSRKQWWQTELKLSSPSLNFARQCLPRMAFLGVSSAEEASVRASLASCSASEWWNLQPIFCSRLNSCSRQEYTISQLASQPRRWAPTSSAPKSRWMRQGSQLKSSTPMRITPSKTGEKKRLPRSPFSRSHRSSSSRPKQRSEQVCCVSAGCRSKITKSCLKRRRALRFRSSARWTGSKGGTYWKWWWTALAESRCAWQSQTRQSGQKSCFIVLERFWRLIGSPRSSETERCGLMRASWLSKKRRTSRILLKKGSRRHCGSLSALMLPSREVPRAAKSRQQSNISSMVRSVRYSLQICIHFSQSPPLSIASEILKTATSYSAFSLLCLRQGKYSVSSLERHWLERTGMNSEQMPCPLLSKLKLRSSDHCLLSKLHQSFGLRTLLGLAGWLRMKAWQFWMSDYLNSRCQSSACSRQGSSLRSNSSIYQLQDQLQPIIIACYWLAAAMRLACSGLLPKGRLQY